MEEKIIVGEQDIKLDLIDSFPNHPYHVFDDTDMSELVASIEANGLLNPIIVRNKADGRYEVISGHRRKRAYEILKISKIRAIVINVNAKSRKDLGRPTTTPIYNKEQFQEKS